MVTACVLAGNSFIGRHLCGRLRQAGIQVVATSRCGDASTGLEACDLTALDQVAPLLARVQPDWVFQCAGATHSNDPQVLYRLHVEGTLRLLAAMRRHVPTALGVLIGSAAEYGPVPPEALPVVEDYPARPPSFFGASKLAQTQAAAAAAQEWQLRLLVVRPFNVIGPGLPAHYFAAALAERLDQARLTTGPGEFPVMNAEATRDFVDVCDVAEALYGLATHAAPAPGTAAVYNIASGRETSVRAVAAKLCRLAGDFQVVDAGAGQSRSSIARSCGDATKLRHATGWEPRVGWEQSIDDLWRAFRDRAGARSQRNEARP